MADVFPTPSFRVPGLLDDEALRERMKLYADQQNREAGAGPTPAAVEFTDRIQREFLDQPTRRATTEAEKLAPEPVPAEGGFAQRARAEVDGAVDAFSAVGRQVLFGLPGAIAEGGPLAKLGTLSPEEQEAETAERFEAAQQQEQAAKRHIETRRALRDLTDDEAAQLGMPIQPGGTDSQTVEEAKQREDDILKSVEQRTAERREALITGQNQVEQSQWLSMSREALRGLQRVPVQTMKLAPILWEAASGFDEKSEMREWLDGVNRNFDAMLPKDNARAKDFMTEVASGTGSMAGFLTLTAIAGVAGIPSKAATFMIGAAQGGSTQFEDAEAHKATAWQKYAALLAGSGLGATEAIPIDRMLLRAENATGGLVSRMLANTASSSMEEFIQEFGQSIGEDVVAKWTYDENREIDVVAALRAGAAGAISGGLAASATSALAEAGFGPQAERDRLAERQAQQPEGGEQTPEARAAEEIAAREAEIDTFIAANQASVDAIIARASGELELVEPAMAAMIPPTETTEVIQPEAGQEQDLTPVVETIKSKGLQPITTTTSEFVAALQRPALYEVSGEVGAGGSTPRLTAEGNITLRHYARDVRETLDPQMMGTGDLRGDEQARLTGPRAVPRTYYGVDSGPDFQEPAVSQKDFIKPTKAELAAAKKLGIDRNRLVAELTRRYDAENRARGYTPESNAWSVVHEVDVGRDELYNIEEDPQNLRARIPETATGNERLTEYEALIRDAGFKGYYRRRSELGQAAVLFDARTPDRVLDRATNLPLDQIARPAEFDAPTPETFQKAGWAVVTATQEADGAFDTPKNLRANAKLRKELRDAGIDFRETEGTYQGVPQGTSFLIFADDATAERIGAKYKQESILTKDGLVYTDGSDRITPARGVVLGDQARAADFQSTLPNGEAFSVDLDFDGTASRQDLFAASTQQPKGKGGTTSTSRTRLRGEPQRASGGIAQTGPVGASESLASLSQGFIKLMDLTARQGRLTLKGGAVGQYSAKQDTVRLKTWNDFSTLVHEGGHALHMSTPGPELTAWVSSNKADLKTAAKHLYGGDVSKMDEATRIAEGFAEFFRVYVTNKAFAKKHYPQMTQSFDDLLTQTAPDLKAGLDAVGAGFQAWLQKPSAALIRDMVVSGAEPGAINRNLAEISEGGFGNWFSGVARGVINGLVDRNVQLNKLVADVLNKAEENAGKALDLKRAEDPRVLIRLATNAGNRAIVQTTDGVMGYQSTDPATRGLQEALLRYHGVGPDGSLRAIDPVRKQDFAAYLIALRGLDEYRRFSEGKIERPPLAATLGDLMQAVKDYDAQYGTDFKEAAAIVHEYGMGLWQKSYDAGLISEQTYTEGLDRQFYAPLQRDLSDRDITTGDFSAAAARQGRSIVKRFKGSDRDIIDPMDILMQKTFALERTIAENDVKKALAALADRAGKAGALVERVPAHRLLGSEYSVQEVARQLTKDPNMTAEDAQDLMEMLEPAIEEGNRIALFRSQQAVARGENILFFWEQGKLAAIQLKDGDVGADIINTMNGIGRENMPIWLDAVAMTSSLFRGAVTKWPDFLVVNFIRDQASAFILTNVGYKPFWTGLKGVGDEIRQSGWARQYNAAMGVMGGMNSEALHRARVERDIGALRAKGYIARVFDGTWAGRLRGFARVTELTETGTRLGIFKAAYDRAKADGLTDWEASIEGSYTATDYIDFSLSGNQMLMARRLIPFLNAQLQGLYKLMRTLGSSEVRQRKGLNFVLKAYFKSINNVELSRVEMQSLQTGRKAWLKMMSLGLLGAALSLAFKDDPDYQDTSEYLRATGWVIPMGEGRIFYIPKPFELAVFSNFAERAIEYGSGDESAPKRFGRALAMNLAPPTTPPVLGTAVEQLANYNFFTDTEIVPDYMRALAPELQYNARTSEFAKQLGDLMGWSPLRIDHVMSGLGASAYRDLSAMYNSVASADRPASDTTDWPMTRRFVRDARRGAASSQDFWKYASTVDGTLRRAELTYRNRLDAGLEQAANEFLNGLEPDERAYALLNAHYKADAKRLNPFYRARQINTVISAMRRELYSPLGVDDTTTKVSEPMKISAKTKGEIDKALSELARREMRNTLIYAKDPGWASKQPLPTDTTMNLLLQIHPGLQQELARRFRKAKIYDAQTVQTYWPEARNRLLSDRENAFLGDLVSVAKVTAQ